MDLRSEIWRQEISKNAVSRKLKRFSYSYMEDRITTPGETLTASHNWVANFKIVETNTEFKLENRKKKIFSIALYDIAETWKNSFVNKRIFARLSHIVYCNA